MLRQARSPEIRHSMIALRLNEDTAESRLNLYEWVAGRGKGGGSYFKANGEVLLPLIHRFVDARLTCRNATSGSGHFAERLVWLTYVLSWIERLSISLIRVTVNRLLRDVECAIQKQTFALVDWKDRYGLIPDN